MGRGVLALPSRWRSPLRSLQARSARWLASASYGRKWLVLGAIAVLTLLAIAASGFIAAIVIYRNGAIEAREKAVAAQLV